jgi:aldehyde dehydrogenase (NAD(P)+)
MLRAELAALPARLPFHPHARRDFVAAAAFEPSTEALPPTLRSDLDPAHDRASWSREHFTPVLLETALDGASPDAWAARASAFVRDEVFGSLAAYVFAPAALDPAVVDATVRALPHGTIAVNCWTGVGYGLGTTPWGVPASAPWQHGVGWSRGTACVTDVQRVVVTAPLRPVPLPPWLRTSGGGAAALRALTRFWLAPSALRATATICHALRSP